MKRLRCSVIFVAVDIPAFFFFQFCRVDPRVDTSWQQLKSAVKVCYVRILTETLSTSADL